MNKKIIKRISCGLMSVAFMSSIFVGCTPNKATTANSKAASQSSKVKELSIEEVKKAIKEGKTLFVDTREDSYYNGYKEQNANQGGHIDGAVQYTAKWVGKVNKDKLAKFVADKGIAKDKEIVVYASNEKDTASVSEMLNSLGYEKVNTFSKFNDLANDKDVKLTSFKEYQTLVNANWVKDALDGKKVENLMNEKLIVLEANWGELDKAKSYNEGHIKGSIHFNTDWVEEGPLWNLSPVEKIQANLEKVGLDDKTSVVVYSDDASAAGRVYYALKAVGLKDVKILNGDINAWKEAGFEVTKDVPTLKPSKFSKALTLDRSIDIERAQEAFAKQKEGLKLVSIRSWDEYQGKTSGYDYIPTKGEPKGAIWGFAGSDASSMQDYYDPDGTLRNPLELAALWEKQGIKPEDKIAFYCGTGWRATLAFEMAKMLGWQNVVIFDGGWNDWQMDKNLPIQTEAPNNMQKPDSMNDFK